jgi:hypothetical protein
MTIQKLKYVLFGCGLVLAFTIPSCENKTDNEHEHGEETHTHDDGTIHSHDTSESQQEEIDDTTSNNSAPMEAPKEEKTHTHEDGKTHTH